MTLQPEISWIPPRRCTDKHPHLYLVHIQQNRSAWNEPYSCRPRLRPRNSTFLFSEDEQVRTCFFSSLDAGALTSGSTTTQRIYQVSVQISKAIAVFQISLSPLSMECFSLGDSASLPSAQATRHMGCETITQQTPGSNSSNQMLGNHSG